MSETRLDIVKRAFDAFGRRDIAELQQLSDPEVEFSSAAVNAVEGSSDPYRGADGLRKYFADLDEVWETFEFEVDSTRELGDQIVALCRVHAVSRSAKVPFDHGVAQIFRFKGGLIASVLTFMSHEEALETAASEEAKA